MPLILEGIVTTHSPSGVLNIAPMGPMVDESLTWLQLRPFQTSTTFANLKATGVGVFHVIDDVLLIAQAALGPLESVPETQPAMTITGSVLMAAARWYEFRVETLDDSRERTEIMCRVQHVGRIKDLFGFHRARHAVLEATILATRCHLIPEGDLRKQLADLKTIVDKTAGPHEQAAFQHVEKHVDAAYSGR